MGRVKGSLPGVLVIENASYRDERGYFLEIFQESRYNEMGVTDAFVQDNISYSKQSVLRGLHFQKTKAQGKLISVLEGNVFDVVADVNPNSPTFGQYMEIELSAENSTQLWIPPGYAHGFCVLSLSALFHYKVTTFYDPTDEAGVIWDDPELNVQWPVSNPSISEKDAKLPTLRQLGYRAK